MEEKKIASIELAMAVNFGGLVISTVNAEKHFLTLTRVQDGVFVEGKRCAKFVPLTNIKGIDYETAEGVVLATGKI